MGPVLVASRLRPWLLSAGLAQLACSPSAARSPEPAAAVAAPAGEQAEPPAPAEGERDAGAVEPDATTRPGQAQGAVAALSTVVESEPVAVTGSLSKEDIRTEIRRHLPNIRLCYERGLVKQPTLEGRLQTSFTIGADGSVIEAKADGFADPKVGPCVVSALRAMKFPPPRGGGIVVISYPFIFETAP